MGSCTERACSRMDTKRCIKYREDSNSNDNGSSDIDDDTDGDDANDGTDDTTSIEGCSDNCKQWFDGCNRCQCSSDGTIVGCTKMYCAAPSPARCMDDDSNTGTNTPSPTTDQQRIEALLRAEMSGVASRRASTACYLTAPVIAAILAVFIM